MFKFGFVGLFKPVCSRGRSGVKGAKPPSPNKDWPAVSGAALSAPTRTDRRKKVLYHITFFVFFLFRIF